MRRETNKTWNVTIDSDFTNCDLIITIHSIRQDNEKEPMLLYFKVKDVLTSESENKVFYGRTIYQCMKQFKRYLNDILPIEESFYLDYNFKHEKLFFYPKKEQFEDLKDFYQTIKESTILNSISDYSYNFE